MFILYFFKKLNFSDNCCIKTCGACYTGYTLNSANLGST